MNEFEKLVQTMRSAQRSYFKTRDNYWLQKSKEYEKQVDSHIFNKLNPTLL